MSVWLAIYLAGAAVLGTIAALDMRLLAADLRRDMRPIVAGLVLAWPLTTLAALIACLAVLLLGAKWWSRP